VRSRSIYYSHNLAGEIIGRAEFDYSIATQGDPVEIWHRFAGREIGYVSNNGTRETDYATSIANRTAVQGSGAFFNGATSATPYGDFVQDASPINSYGQGGAGGAYVIRSGDTLSNIAATLWGDSALWYKLAEANGLSANTQLAEGQTLTVPPGVMRNTHNAGTFKAYDPNAAIGDTSPAAPAPARKGKGCGVLGAVILAVIAIVVVAVLKVPMTNFFAQAFGATAKQTAAAIIVAKGGAGVAAGALGAGGTAALVAGGAAAGAVGSIVSQGVGVATGIQEKFSWNAVAMAAIGGGVGAGVGRMAPALNQVSRAMVSSAVAQAIGVAVGAQDKFSWAGVAAAGAGAWAGGQFENDIASSTASLLADAATRSLIERTDFGDNIMAALPNVIGQMIGEAITGRVARRSEIDAASAHEDVDVVGYGDVGKSRQDAKGLFDWFSRRAPPTKVVREEASKLPPNPDKEYVIVTGTRRRSWTTYDFTPPAAWEYYAYHPEALPRLNEQYASASPERTAWDHLRSAIQVRSGLFFEQNREPIIRTVGAVQAITGGLEMVGGVVTVGVGAATSEAVIGIPIAAGGVWMLGNGWDNARTGVRTVLTGELQQTDLHRTLRSMGLSDQQASTGEIVLSLGAASGPAFAREAVEQMAIRSIADKAMEVWTPELHYVGRNRVTFDGMEIRAVRDLSHIDESTLRAMAELGFAARTRTGDRLILHHHKQDPAGFLVEMPEANHSIWNRNQHPLGNVAGAGLTAEQRAAFDAWRTDYWQARARAEMRRRAEQ
jgi:hypothetical protein